MASATQERDMRVGVFANIDDADRAVNGLLDAGFTIPEITVVCSDKYKEARFEHFHHQDPAGSKTPLAAASGSAIGAAIGAATAGASALVTGGVSLLILGGAAIWTGGVVGGLVGAMMSRGVEREAANFYDQAVTKGKILVAATAHGPAAAARLTKAEQALHDANAEPLAMPEG